MAVRATVSFPAERSLSMIITMAFSVRVIRK
jgi:hypothetical protein